jgi:hypothetical protein
MRRALAITALSAVAGVLFVAGFGFAGTNVLGMKLTARLVPRAEVPAPKQAAAATGVFTASLSGRTLVWRLTFSHLTGRALAAHIHVGRPGKAGPVAVPLCGPCASGAHGKTVVTSKVRSAILAGGAYVNVHTATNPGGEIRGQVVKGGAASPIMTTHDDGQTTTTTTDSSGGYGRYG